MLKKELLREARHGPAQSWPLRPGFHPGMPVRIGRSGCHACSKATVGGAVRGHRRMLGAKLVLSFRFRPLDGPPEAWTTFIVGGAMKLHERWAGGRGDNAGDRGLLIVPTVPVGTHPVTLCVRNRRSGKRFVPTLERGNDQKTPNADVERRGRLHRPRPLQQFVRRRLTFGAIRFAIAPYGPTGLQPILETPWKMKSSLAIREESIYELLGNYVN